MEYGYGRLVANAYGALKNVTATPLDVLKMERVTEVVKLVRVGLWRDDSVTEWARKWQVSPAMARSYIEAGKMIAREGLVDAEQVQMEVCAAMRIIMQRTLDDNGESQANTRMAIEAARLWAQISGAMAPKKVHVSASTTSPVDDERARERYTAIVLQALRESPEMRDVVKMELQSGGLSKPQADLSSLDLPPDEQGDGDT